VGILEKNLEVLRRGNSAIVEKIEAAAKDASRTPAHPDPAEAPEELARVRAASASDATILLCVGIGSGAWIPKAVESLGPTQWLQIFEGDYVLLADVLSTQDLASTLADPRISVISGEETLKWQAVSTAVHIMTCVHDQQNVESPDAKQIEVFFISGSPNPARMPDYAEFLTKLKGYITEVSGVLPRIHKQMLMSEELAEYLNLPVIEVSRRVGNASVRIANEWYAVNPRTPEEVHRWYAETDKYLYDLAYYHIGSDSYLEALEETLKVCREHGGHILDFGGGDGDLCIRLAELGLDVTYCDVPGITMDFAIWRFNKRGLAIKRFASDDPHTVALPETYDIIIAMDVLEHLVNPLHYCSVFFNNLRPGGLFIAKPSFSNHDMFPMHLRSNAAYIDTFNDEMARIGFINMRALTPSLDIWEKPA
jgi:2-polyprenyl-3-methyl-5-hydroxy-6-metoxy-1,4-benzoquinol methylase